MIFSVRWIFIGLVLATPTFADPLLEFEGTLYPQRFLRVKGIGYGHHAIVWEGGKAADKALIVAKMPDREVADQLSRKGLVGGNNLTDETWSARNDTKNSAADERVQGPTVEIIVSWPGLDVPVSLGEILGMDVDYRFGDHRALIPVWKSGCIVCNVSCPGGKISNHTLTIRDQVMKRLRPHLDPTQLPKDGTAVRVWIRN